MSFLAYIHNRRYNFGRGAQSSWAFIAAARGDPEFPDTSSWHELRDHLVQRGMGDMLDAARVVWRTYQGRLQKGELTFPYAASRAGSKPSPPSPLRPAGLDPASIFPATAV